MSNAKVKYMLKDCAWREVITMWAEELEERPKPCVLKELVIEGFEARSEARTPPPPPPPPRHV